MIAKEVSDRVCAGTRPDEAIASVAETARIEIERSSGVALTQEEETVRVVRRSYLATVEAALGEADFLAWRHLGDFDAMDVSASLLGWIAGQDDLVPVAVAALCLDEPALAAAAAAYWGTAADDEDEDEREGTNATNPVADHRSRL